jgi:hypothetical protein
MKFCGYSSVQTTRIEKSFLKLNILQAERTGGEEEEKEKKSPGRRAGVGEIPAKFGASL